MSANLDSLAQILPAPPGIVAAPPWQYSHSEIGINFPSDYREFVERYGGGAIGIAPRSSRFFIYAPCSQARRPGAPGGFQEFVDKTDSDIGPDFDGGDEEFWGGTVYRVRPHPGGMIAWGENQEGDVFFWLTEDPDPDRWPVVMWARGIGTTYRTEGGMVAFLLDVFTGNHPASEWLAKPNPWWTMESDWLRQGLAISAGPAA